MRSVVYVGTVTHRRAQPAHAFVHRLAVPLVDLTEVDELCALHPAFSSRRPAPVRFRRSDFYGHGTAPLDEAVRDKVAEETGVRPTGPISLLAQWRTFGWQANPISCYFGFDAAGERVEWLLAEVTNTPWHERHAYVVGPPGTHELAKRLHVSPFVPDDVTYRLSYDAPGPALALGLDVVACGAELLSAALELERRPASRAALAELLWRHPALPLRISGAIYLQAARLARKGATVYRHPGVGGHDRARAR